MTYESSHESRFMKNITLEPAKPTSTEIKYHPHFYLPIASKGDIICNYNSLNPFVNILNSGVSHLLLPHNYLGSN